MGAEDHEQATEDEVGNRRGGRQKQQMDRRHADGGVRDADCSTTGFADFFCTRWQYLYPSRGPSIAERTPPYYFGQRRRIPLAFDDPTIVVDRSELQTLHRQHAVPKRAT